jgi:imidazolonepropionase
MSAVLYRRARLLSVSPADSSVSVINNAALLLDDGVIRFAGSSADLPRRLTRKLPSVDLKQQLITPGFIDCHTHAVFAGNRAHEFAQRLAGASYVDIAKAGGGIQSTVRSTAGSSVATLVRDALPRLLALRADGVRGVEIKSGYGLSFAAEKRMLLAASAAAKQANLRVQRTYLGLHALPAECKTPRARKAFVHAVCGEWLPKLHALGLVDAIDAFLENIGFSSIEVRQLFDTARRLRIPIKLHAEQLSNSEGAALAAQYCALSADHLEYLSPRGVRAMRAANMTAVLLPGAFYCLKEKKLPPIKALRKHRVPMAVSTDLNPGTSPLSSIRLAMHMACTFFGLSVAEALCGVTCHAAKALGWSDMGQLREGFDANALVWAIDDPAEIVYWLGSLHAPVSLSDCA